MPPHSVTQTFRRMLFALTALALLATTTQAQNPIGAQADQDPGLQGPVFRMAIPAAKDNTLYESATGALSNGAGNFLFAGQTNQMEDRLRRFALAFDLAGYLPTDTSVDSVTLQLTMSMSLVGNVDVSLHRAQADWGEGTSQAGMGEGEGAPATTGDATWLHSFFDTDFWTTPGGDFDAATSGIQVVGGNGRYTWGPTVEMVTDVQNWIDTPASNFGWIVLGDEDAAGPNSKRFNSRTHGDPATRPALVVNFLSNSTIFVNDFESGDTTGWSSATP